MGFDFDRIIGENKELLKCYVCFDLVENPIQLFCCGQYFCMKCIEEWLSRNQNPNIGHCPYDRSRITRNKFGSVPRIVNQLLESFSIRCQFTSNGCQTVCKLSEIESHEKVCDYRNGVLIYCDCGLWISRMDLSFHKCIQCLRQRMEIQDKTISKLENQLRETRLKLSRLNRYRMRYMRRWTPKKLSDTRLKSSNKTLEKKKFKRISKKRSKSN